MRKRSSTTASPDLNPKQLTLSTETLRSLRAIAEKDLDLVFGGRGSCSHAVTGCG